MINAGGVINISHEGPAYRKPEAVAHVTKIHDTLGEIFRRADAEGIPTSEAADRLAEERLTRARTGTNGATETGKARIAGTSVRVRGQAPRVANGALRSPASVS